MLNKLEFQCFVTYYYPMLAMAGIFKTLTSYIFLWIVLMLVLLS